MYVPVREAHSHRCRKAGCLTWARGAMVSGQQRCFRCCAARCTSEHPHADCTTLPIQQFGLVRRMCTATAPVLTLLSAPTTTPPSYCTATIVVPVCGASPAAWYFPMAALLRQCAQDVLLSTADNIRCAQGLYESLSAILRTARRCEVLQCSSALLEGTDVSGCASPRRPFSCSTARLSSSGCRFSTQSQCKQKECDRERAASAQILQARPAACIVREGHACLSQNGVVQYHL